jgi:hypothetical protein
MASQSDITVETTSSAQQELIQEQENKAAIRLLLAMGGQLRDLVIEFRQFRLDSFNRFTHLELLLSRAQEKASIPRAIPIPVAASASGSAIPTIPKVPTASVTPASVSVPRVPAPAFASAPVKKVSVRPAISLNPLKAVPPPKPSKVVFKAFCKAVSHTEVLKAKGGHRPGRNIS